MKFIKLKTDEEDVSIRISTIDSIIKHSSNKGVELFAVHTTNNNTYEIRDERYTYDSFIDMLNKEYGFENFDK